MIDKDTQMFDSISLSDVFRKIYNNSEYKKSRIDGLLDTVRDLVGNVTDASLLLPMIKEVLEISVKNDEQLVKLAMIMQRLLDKNESSTIRTIEDLLPEEEKQKLLKDNSENINIVPKEIDDKVEKLSVMIKNAKEEIKKTEKKNVDKVDK